MQVRHIYYDANNARHENTQECSADLAQIHVVDLGVNDWEGFEKGIVCCVDERSIDVDEEYGRIEDRDLNRLDERVPNDSRKDDVGCFDLGSRLESAIACESA